MRINQHVAQVLGYSRREVDRMIEKGRVRVNGAAAQLGQQVDPLHDKVLVDGRRMATRKKHNTTIALYKPRDCLTTRSDPKKRKTVMSLLPKELQHLKPVGRLDFESEGLLLLSDDGKLILEATHPRYEREKEYRVFLEKPVTQALLSHLLKGVKLRDGFAKVDTVEQRGAREIVVVTHQGWNRQLRRMATACRNRVTRLVRIRSGDILLENLQPGEWRTIHPNKTT